MPCRSRLDEVAQFLDTVAESHDPSDIFGGPLFVFDRQGRPVFANAAARRFAPDRIEELRSLAIRLFEHRPAGTSVGEPMLGHAGRPVEFAFAHSEGTGEPHAVALMVSDRLGNGGPARQTDEATLVSVLLAAGATPAELVVAEQLWQGKLEKEVARAIHRSLPTVKFHAGKLYRRCGVSRRPEWMAWISAKIDRSRCAADPQVRSGIEEAAREASGLGVSDRLLRAAL